MGKVQQILLTALLVLVLLFLALFLFISVYGKRLKIEKPEEKALMCYVCEARINYPPEDELRGEVRRSIKNIVGPGGEPVRKRYSSEIEECLNNPQFKRQCEIGQHCAVLRQKINEVERVVRSCSTGGKLGCNSDVVDGIKEKACFCNSDLCLQVPYFFDRK